MNLYTNFWEEQLLAINKRIKTSEATEYVVSDCGIDKLGSRDSSGYDGSVSLWMGEIDSPLRKAVFRDFAKALNKENKNLLPKAIGRLEVRIRNNSDLHVSYEPISFESILDKYEELQQKDNYLSEEIYKWELTKAFQDQWKRYESNEISFKDFFGKISFKNLAYHMCIAIYNHILREKPDEFEKLITYLFDERIDLQERIIEYRRRFDELYFSLPDHGANTYEEERTIATLLAFRYPEKYTFYKDNFYSKLCKGLGIEAQKPVYKLAHYYALVENFRTNHLTNRNALIQKNKATLNSNCDLDINNLILSQDILYTTLVSQIKSNFIEEELDISIPETLVDNSKTKSMKQPLNQILYGPPGTGKTYNSIFKALMIIEELNESEIKVKYPTRKDAKDAFDIYIQKKQIAFTTFHQSMSYEDFIEGIKPLKPNEGEQFLKYDVLPGIFKEMCDNAKYIEANVSTIDWNNRRFFKMSIGGKNRPDVHEWCLQNNKIAFGYGGEKDLSSFTTRDGWEKFRDKFNADLPDVVKETSYNTTASYAFLDMKIGDIVFISKGNFLIDAIGIISGEYEYNPNVPEVEYVHFRSIDWVVKDMNISVERFLKKNFSQQTIYYLNKNDVKIDALESLTSDKKDSNVKPYVLIIDEINRGNVSQIFGELITLIEEDKRQGKAEALKVMLPYSKKEFSVPPNLFIVGTMNTADRSVEALDTALRRRFTFEEIPPNENLDLIQYPVFDTTASAILKTLNARIEKLLDKDHKLGHSFFIKKDSDSAEEKIVETFYKNIIPLLQEYFFGDFGKIGLVLGKGFVTVDNSNVPIFADFDYESKEDYQVKEIYSIRDFRINNDMIGFKDAIKLLMANK
ncbi:MAG: AAA family ATPase [Chitinophagaceae bacterium]